MQNKYDIIVVGSGPGGSTVAREMARSGKRVLLLEKGKNFNNLGGYISASRMLDKYGFFKSKEGLTMLKVTTTGGATMVYSGSAAMPPPWLKSKYKIDIEDYAKETFDELNVTVLPEELLGETSKSVMDAGNRLGQDWEPMPKLLDIKKFKKGKQSSAARTSLGLNYGERWTARDYIKQAVDSGASLLTEAECEDVIVRNGRAVGVKVRLKRSGIKEFFSDNIVLAAGGIPTPVLLKRAGVERAGNGCVVDPVILVYGIHPKKGTYKDPLVSVVSWKWYNSHGIRIGTLIDPWLMTLISLAKRGLRHVVKIFKYKRMIGILIKIKDDLGGYVNEYGEVSKSLTEADYKKIEMGVGIACDVLVEAGCKAESIVRGEIRGAHPSGTCRIGDVVNKNLETDIKNLYVCDASIFPEALDRPTVITIIAFGKRLAKHILGRK